MQAIELQTTITNGELHVRLPTDITVPTARVIVLYEAGPTPVNPSNVEVLQFLDELVDRRDWSIRSKEEIDRTLAGERVSWEQ